MGKYYKKKKIERLLLPHTCNPLIIFFPAIPIAASFVFPYLSMRIRLKKLFVGVVFGIIDINENAYEPGGNVSVSFRRTCGLEFWRELENISAGGNLGSLYYSTRLRRYLFIRYRLNLVLLTVVKRDSEI